MLFFLLQIDMHKLFEYVKKIAQLQEVLKFIFLKNKRI